MAIMDMFGRPIEKGDLVVRIIPRAEPMVIDDVVEGSLLTPNPQAVPVSELHVSMKGVLPLPNPARMPNLQCTDLMIVRKGIEEPAAGNA